MVYYRETIVIKIVKDERRNGLMKENILAEVRREDWLRKKNIKGGKESGPREDM